METLAYTIDDSTIAKLLGETNFSTAESAVLELVKNAYDAGASEFAIEFADGSMFLTDDGKGMNADDIRNQWMFVGRSSKEYEEVDMQGRLRVVAGSKGVGRFALARLGEKVEVQSKAKGSSGVIWRTDWSGSTLVEDSLAFERGTRIKISGLRDRWTKKIVDKMALFLSKTYNDDKMHVTVAFDDNRLEIEPFFKEARLGFNCVEVIQFQFDATEGSLSVEVISDEFEPDVAELVQGIDIHSFNGIVSVYKALRVHYDEYSDSEFSSLMKSVGPFSSELFFSLKGSTVSDVEKFKYRYRSLPSRYDSGVVLYRNAFSIVSYEGTKDWIGLGRRARKSPASPTHASGSWRVRENQLAGFVSIDRRENAFLLDLANRQGLEENAQYNLFIDIIDLALKEFERYRQSIIRAIAENRAADESKRSESPISDAIVSGSLGLDKMSHFEFSNLKSEIKEERRRSQRAKEDAVAAEERHRYDVRILNVLATAGLKSASLAHQLKNDENALLDNSSMIREALIEYGLWEEVNRDERVRYAFNNIPELLETGARLNKKMVQFIDESLADIEKKRFAEESSNLKMELKKVSEKWKRTYSQLSIDVDVSSCEVGLPPDALQVIFDNLILNSYQQNSSRQVLLITIKQERSNEDAVLISYCDDGVGLTGIYREDPFRILEVHETTRREGHGLGMWIVNNTLLSYGGKVVEIGADNGFRAVLAL